MADFQTVPEVTFDHVVHCVRDLEKTRQLFNRELGVPTVRGGEHPAWGTWNALAYFGLSYIEWLGVKDPMQAQAADFGRLALRRLAAGEGGSLFALRTSAMDRLAETWRMRGLSFQGPLDASRQRPDGTVIRWRMMFPEDLSGRELAHGDALLPFAIQWAEDDETREASLRSSGAVNSERLFQILTVHVATGDPLAWARRYSRYYGATQDTAPAESSGRLTTRIHGTTLDIDGLRIDSRLPENTSAQFPGVVQLDVAGPGLTPGTKKELAGLTVAVVGP